MYDRYVWNLVLMDFLLISEKSIHISLISKKSIKADTPAPEDFLVGHTELSQNQLGLLFLGCSLSKTEFVLVSPCGWFG